MEPIERTFKTEFELSKESTYYKLEALRSNEYPGKLFNEIMGKKKIAKISCNLVILLSHICLIKSQIH